ncbi:MAG TPA: glutathione binding-like protein [Kofleriaceae bacterium]|jgi:GST-like protein
MSNPLSEFPVAKKFPPKHPDRLQLYSLPTPNGVKASIMLEETGLPYEVHKIDFDKKDQKSPEYLALDPNGKIPSMIDPDGPGGKPLPLFESGAILHYLADKSRKLLPFDGPERWHVMQWVFLQVGHIGPMFGQAEFYLSHDGKEWDEPKSRQRYVDESKRLLGVLDGHLDGREWFVGSDITIADIAMVGWVRAVFEDKKAAELMRVSSFTHAKAWLDRMLARPAVKRGLKIP